MPKFRATVRMREIEAPDATAVLRQLDERMKGAGFTNWKVVSIEAEGAGVRPRTRYLVPGYRAARGESWKLFMVAAGAWAVWFLWLLWD